MAKSKSIANMSVSLTASIGKFKKGMKNADRILKRWGFNVRKMAGNMVKFGAAIAAAIPVATALALRRTLKTIDELAKISGKLGISTKALSSLRFAAGLAGVKITTLDMALQRLIRRVSEAAKNTGEAQAAIKELGLNAADLVKLPVEKIMLRIAKAFEGVKLQADKVRLSFKLFDSEGVSLIQIVGRGEKTLKAMMDRAKALGVVVDKGLADKVERTSDSMFELTQLMKGSMIQATGAVANQITDLVNALIKVEQNSGSVSTVFVQGFQLMVSASKIFLAVILKISSIINRLRALGAAAIGELILMVSEAVRVLDSIIPVSAKASLGRKLFEAFGVGLPTIRAVVTNIEAMAQGFLDTEKAATDAADATDKVVKALFEKGAGGFSFKDIFKGVSGALTGAGGRGGTGGVRAFSRLRDVIPGGSAGRKQIVFDANADMNAKEAIRILKRILLKEPQLVIPNGN